MPSPGFLNLRGSKGKRDVSDFQEAPVFRPDLQQLQLSSGGASLWAARKGSCSRSVTERRVLGGPEFPKGHRCAPLQEQVEEATCPPAPLRATPRTTRRVPEDLPPPAPWRGRRAKSPATTPAGTRMRSWTMTARRRGGSSRSAGSPGRRTGTRVSLRGTRPTPEREREWGCWAKPSPGWRPACPGFRPTPNCLNWTRSGLRPATSPTSGSCSRKTGLRTALRIQSVW